jgi:protein TonB
VRIGGKVQEPKLLRRVDAVYPPMARQARVGGVVRIQATIAKDGKVKKIEVLSGPPLLRQAAMDAVQKWVYSPSLLNGSPVEATTDVDVNFNLSAR